MFLRACDEELNTFEELLEIVLLYATTNREDVFNYVCELMEKYNLPLSKLFSVATDRASYMEKKNKDFVFIALYIKKF